MLMTARRILSGAPFLFLEALKLAIVGLVTPIAALAVGGVFLSLMMETTPAAHPHANAHPFFAGVLVVIFGGLLGAGALIYGGMIFVGLPVLALLRHFGVRSYLVYGGAGFVCSALYFSLGVAAIGYSSSFTWGIPVMFGLPTGLISRLFLGALDWAMPHRPAIRASSMDHE